MISLKYIKNKIKINNKIRLLSISSKIKFNNNIEISIINIF